MLEVVAGFIHDITGLRITSYQRSDSSVLRRLTAYTGARKEIVFMDTSGKNTIRSALRSGRADWITRVVLSLASAAALGGLALLLLCICDTVAPRVFLHPTILVTETGQITIRGTKSGMGDEWIALMFGLAGFLWCWTVVWLWGPFVRSRRAGRYGVWIVLGLVICATGVLVDVALLPSNEPWIASFLLVFGSALLVVLARAWYRHNLPRCVVAGNGEVDVHCPDCGYSMVGLHDARCPECGARFTLDELIRAQGYGQAQGTTGGL